MRNSTPEKLVDIALRRLLALAYKDKGARAFANCGSNGGDACHYCYEISSGVCVFFSNHGYIDMHGLDIYTKDEHEGLYAPKLRAV